jgi:hypothetical protein
MVIDARDTFLKRMARVVSGYTKEQMEEATAHLVKLDRNLLRVKLATIRLSKKGK